MSVRAEKQAAARCRFYNCAVGSKPCQRMRSSGQRLYCLECALVGTPLRQPPPEELEIKIILDNCGYEDFESSEPDSADEVSMENVEAQPQTEKVIAAENPAPAANAETFGQALRRRREERGMSVRTLAKAIGVSFHSIYKWETDAYQPAPETIGALEAFFQSGLVGAPEKECSKQSPELEVEQIEPQVAEIKEATPCSNPADSSDVEQVEESPDARHGAAADPGRLNQDLNIVLQKSFEVMQIMTDTFSQALKSMRRLYVKTLTLDEFVVQEEELLHRFKSHWEYTRQANCRLPMCLTSEEWTTAFNDFIAENYSDGLSDEN